MITTTSVTVVCQGFDCGITFEANTRHKKLCSKCISKSKHRARDAAIEASHIKVCPDCGNIFEAVNVRKLVCEYCDFEVAERKANHTLNFVCIDGEGMPGKCFVCPCLQFKASVSDDEMCNCGHPKLPLFRDSGTIDSAQIGPGHDHKYVLVGCGPEHCENLEGLHWKEIFEFLYRQFEGDPRTVYVGFFLSYDFAQWLKTLPVAKAKELYSKAGIAERKQGMRGAWPKPVRHEGWEFDIIGAKRLRIRPLIGCKCIYDRQRKRKFGPDGKVCHHYKPYMYINDAGGFWQTSYLNVLHSDKWAGNPVVTEQEYALIEEGKETRGSASLDDDMRRYMSKEIEVFPRVMTRLNECLVNLGVKLNRYQWFGPGQAAQAWLRQHKDISTGEQLREYVPWLSVYRGRCAYYGGWFEIMMHGIVPGISYEYDINNAYTWVITGLPCLKHGTWEYRGRDGTFEILTSDGSNPTDDELLDYDRLISRIWPGHSKFISYDRLPELPENAIRMIHGVFKGSDPYIGALPFRLKKTDTIVRPNVVRGWYWQHEIEACIRAGLIDSCECWEWITYEPCDCKLSLSEMNELYEERLREKFANGGTDTQKGMTIKLTLESCYGKFAQSAGDPPYNNWIYASLITSGCRTKIVDAIATHPGKSSAVSMIATDGVYFTSEHPGIKHSHELGGWKMKEKSNLVQYMPGRYWDDEALNDIANGKKPKFKSRGVNASHFGKVLHDITRQFGSWPKDYPPEESWPTCEVVIDFAVITCQQAIQWNKWELAGKAFRKVQRYTCYPDSKRTPGYYDHPYYRSRPFNSTIGTDGYVTASRNYHSSSNEDHFEMVNQDGGMNSLTAKGIGTSD